MFKTSLAKPFSVLWLFCAFVALSFTIFGQDKTWRPVTPEELQLESPVAEKDADAEALFWDVWIDDSSRNDLSMRHYVRVKVFTERGREKYSKFDIPYLRGTKIKDLTARVVRADGTSVEVTEKDIFDREIVKVGGLKLKAKSFAVPNIEPGVIVEYRYRESIDDNGAAGMRLALQRDVPVQSLTYYYKPYNKREPNYQPYNLTGVKFEKHENGYWIAKRTNVPSFKDEPRMPPEDSVRPWILLTSSGMALTDVSAFSISFVVKDPSNPRTYWAAVAAQNARWAEFMLKGGKDIAKVALEVTAGETSDEGKLRKIYDFVQNEIRNTTFDPTLTDEERRKLPKVSSLNDVLKRKMGSAAYIDMLFGSMAASLGMDVTVALTSDRSKMFFNPNMTNENFIHLAAVAVRVGTEPRLFNPGLKFLPYGMLAWYEEDTWALLVGEKTNQWIETPLTQHDRTRVKRSGRFTLSDDGTLEGDVTEELTGQMALSYRLDKYDESPSKLEEDLKEDLKRRVSTAEVSGITIENVTDHSKPIIQRYRIRIPSYAQKTGKRLFLQPSFFEYGNNPVFSSSTRKYDVYFRYPWSEHDDVQITLPKGFELDNADAPSPLSDPGKIGLLDVKLSLDRANNKLLLDRKFYFGGNSKILFPARSYQPLKNLWDGFHKIDSHTISLKSN